MVAPLVTREELDAFCRQGRLAGTSANRDAGAILKHHLEQAGFTVLEGPALALSGRSLVVIAALLVAVAVLRDKLFSIPIFLVLAAGPLFRVWRGIRTGTPAAVYGVRTGSGSAVAAGDGGGANAPVAGRDPRPTVVLCAHYDSASVPFPFRGSLVTITLGAVGVMALVGLLSVRHSVAGLVATGALWGVILLAVLGRNRSPGADDNASGVFTVLECVRRFGHLEGVNIVPVFFNFEEQGLLGSRAWVRGYVGRKGQGIPGLEVDPTRAYAINFDCVGRGSRVFISGNRHLRERLLRTPTARALRAKRTWLYPSDHLAFRAPWKAVSFVRANRFWALDLGWVHSPRDAPTEIRLENLSELSRIVEDFVMEIAAGSAVQAAGSAQS